MKTRDGDVKNTTAIALEMLRMNSFANDEALMESELEPLFTALDARAMLSDTGEGTLDTFIIPGLRRILRKSRNRNAFDARRCAFDILIGVWSARLVDEKGCGITAAIDPFSRRAKWSLSTPVFATIISQCEMVDLFHGVLRDGESKSKTAMMNALIVSETPQHVVAQLTAVTVKPEEASNFDSSLREQNSAAIVADEDEQVSRIHDAFVAPKVSEQERFLRELLECDSSETVAEMIKKVPGSSVSSALLLSSRFKSLRKIVKVHEDDKLAEIDRELITLLNRITSSTNASVASHMAMNLSNELTWPMLVSPETTCQRLIYTAVANSSQSSIIVAALKSSPSLTQCRASAAAPPYLLAAFADFLRNIPTEFDNTKAADAVSFLCEALFTFKSGGAPVFDSREGLLYVVLPLLAPTFLSESSMLVSMHGSYFALCVLNTIAFPKTSELDVEIIAQTFPEGILLALAQIIDHSRKHNECKTQIMASALLNQICKGLSVLYEKFHLSAYDIEAFQEADQMASVSVDWDTRTRMESVMSISRVHAALRPTPPSFHTGSMSSLLIDVLKLYGADTGDSILVELLQALQGVSGERLSEFRQSLLVACVLVLPRVSMVEFDRISQTGLPTVLKMLGVVQENTSVPSLVLDTLSHAVMFSIHDAPERALALCRHFTRLASTLVSEAKDTFESNVDSAAIIRHTFRCACDILRELQHLVGRQSLEVLLVSSALTSLQTMNSSPAHKRWAQQLVRALPNSVAKKQLEGALKTYYS